jgi:hypothetical protein
MPSLEERVSYLEGRLEDHAGTVAGLRQDVRDLRQQIVELDSKITRHFTWLVGIQVGVLLAVVGALLER